MTKLYIPEAATGYELVQPIEGDDHRVILDASRGYSEESHWRPVRVRLVKVDEGLPLRAADAPSLSFYEIILKRRAIDVMSDILQRAKCTLLPLDCDECELALIKPPRIDAFDEANAEMARIGGTVIHVPRHAFFREKVSSVPIFKVATKGVGATFVSDQFLARWNAAGIQGTAFRLVWSD